MRIRSLVILSFISLGSATITTAETNVLQLTAAYINALAEEARTNNAALRAAAASTSAAVADAKTIPTWKNPMASFGVMAAERAMRRDDGDLLYEFEQSLPLWGKPQAEQRMARSRTSVAEDTATLRFQQLKRDLARAAFRVGLADQAVRLDQEDLRWLDSLLAATQQRFAVGEATQVEILRLQNEQSRRRNQLETDLQFAGQARANLNRLLNRPLDSPWPEFELPPMAAPVVFNDQLVRFALQYEPELKLRQAEIREAEAAVDVSRRARLPELAAGAELRQYSGDGDLRQGMVKLSLNLPWGNRKRYAAAIQRDQAKLEALQYNSEDYQWALRNEVRALTVKIDAARREALLYRDQITPRSEAALASARTAWEAGRPAGAGFRDVMETRRMLVEARLMEARAVTEQYEMLSELVLCCGLGDLEALQMIGVTPESEKGGTKP